MHGVRSDAPWTPWNIEFIRRVNGLATPQDVRDIVFAARYLGGTLFAIITLGTLVHPAVARAYAVAPLRAQGEPSGQLGLGDAADDTCGGQILG